MSETALPYSVPNSTTGLLSDIFLMGFSHLVLLKQLLKIRKANKSEIGIYSLICEVVIFFLEVLEIEVTLKLKYPLEIGRKKKKHHSLNTFYERNISLSFCVTHEVTINQLCNL